MDNNSSAAQKATSPTTPTEFLRSLRPKDEAPPQIPECLTPAQIARATDALNYVLTAFGVPDKFRAFIDAIIGASEGSLDWFEATDFVIGQRAREVNSRQIKRSAVEKWAQ